MGRKEGRILREEGREDRKNIEDGRKEGIKKGRILRRAGGKGREGKEAGERKKGGG
jgi:hypothetical protein